MPLTYKFYRAPRVPGVFPRSFANKLREYIVEDGSGSGFSSWINDAHPVFYSLARADSTVHATIALDTAITALSPELADIGAVNAWFDGLALTNLSVLARNQLETDGFNAGWLSALSTTRDMVRYMSRFHIIGQELKRVKSVNGLAFLAYALDQRVNQIPVAQRNAVQNWMQGKGLATGWITGSTTVRQVVHFILENVNWPLLPFGMPEINEF